MNDPAAASRPPRFPIHRLWLVSCGETEDTDFFPDFTGHSDPALSRLGQRQAEAIAAKLTVIAATPPVAAIYSSPLKAAWATAEVIAAALGIAAVRASDELVTVMPEVLTPGRDGLAALSMLQERAWGAVEALKERHEPDVGLILVSHRLPIQAMVARALSIPLEDTDRYEVGTASISAIEFRGPRTILHVLNDLCHLDDAGS